MADVIIRAPLSGKNLAQVNYCPPGSGSHPVVLYANPLDIGGSGTPAGTTITFYGGTLVKSVKTIVRSGIVCVASFQPPDNVIDDAVEVQFYSEPNAPTGSLIGKVLYAHVKDWSLYITNGGVYNVSAKTVGKVPGLCSCSCPSGGCVIGSGCACHCVKLGSDTYRKCYCLKKSDCNTTCASCSGCTQTGACPCACCYGSVHIHMECSTDVDQVYSFSCGQNLYEGSTNIFKWII